MTKLTDDPPGNAEFLLTKEDMAAFGFVYNAPRSNMGAEWFENEELGITFYKLPTTTEFLHKICAEQREAGVEYVRGAIRGALGL